ncbi:dihydrofolate reductase [Buchnera aphidicola]|uniref:Dihydrofolate reductase n=1 Tax=Buchnera aphidicola (Anoecia oenotherae) TaxID=1241833 RepID=A0A4D6XV39_9GAMM|nr:dihydrofolate reductase [Buchnera aphidicola]QCI19247.1 dihydrofolate reductase [Buchnera aphidicola (Anoecia oenotherae)]
MISIIVAISKNFVIGYKNKIPWHIPNDLLWFKKNTIKKVVLMGRLTWESIGTPLSMRVNLVLSKKKTYFHKNVISITSIEEGLKISKILNLELVIIGGSSIYKSMLPFSKKIYLTCLNTCFHGDTFFPILDKSEWNQTFFVKKKDNFNFFNYTFSILER